MKKFFLFFVVACLYNSVYSQRTVEFQKYLNDSIFKSDNANYISIHYGKGNDWSNSLTYSIKKENKILTINYGDSVFLERAIIKPYLFDIVKKNKSKIWMAFNSDITKQRIKECIANTDTTIIFPQMGIRFNEFLIGHVPKFSLEEIEKTKNKKRKQGMLIINQLYAILEEAEKSK
jgi:hypothetical protein